jgi:hypothetical protein
MAIYDRPSDLQSPSQTGAPAAGGGMSPSLSDQTPGLDPTSRARSLALRPVSWARERPAIALSILGGLCAIGLGTWLMLRTRRTSRLEDLRGRAEEMVGWLRAKTKL